MRRQDGGRTEKKEKEEEERQCRLKKKEKKKLSYERSGQLVLPPISFFPHDMSRRSPVPSGAPPLCGFSACVNPLTSGSPSQQPLTAIK